MGESEAASWRNIDRFIVNKLTKGQWECVNRLLSQYECTNGDTFYIVIATLDGNNIWNITCEFTSATQYRWWASGIAFLE